MQSPNKPAPTVLEQRHIRRVKALGCGCCGMTAGPSDCHEVKQGQWFTSIPLCEDCHTGSRNGIHGRRLMWILKKKDEWSVLNDTIRKLFYEPNPLVTDVAGIHPTLALARRLSA